VLLDLETLEALARGCGILGAGGGGAPAVGLLAAKRALDLHGPCHVVDLDDLPDGELVLPIGMVGAPTVSIEKIGNGGEGGRIVRRVEELAGRRVAALMSCEIGGSNGLYPATQAARLGLPIVDADGMGRAFPKMTQVSMEIAGVSPSPCVMTDERANVVTIDPADGPWLETLCRATAVAFGGRAISSEYLMAVGEARRATVRGTISLAVRIGRAIASADVDPAEALLGEVGGVRLLEGKVVDVERRVTDGFVRGAAQIEGLRDDAGRAVRLELQNENLVALEERRVLASVPDIISVIDMQTGDGLSTELLRYGQRVRVVAFPCDPVWRGPRGLELAGPRSFGYDFDYQPVELLSGDAA
jgi:DUF917 family protein